MTADIAQDSSGFQELKEYSCMVVWLKPNQTKLKNVIHKCIIILAFHLCSLLK